jgi:hypothetical protein
MVRPKRYVIRIAVEGCQSAVSVAWVLGVIEQIEIVVWSE